MDKGLYGIIFASVYLGKQHQGRCKKMLNTQIINKYIYELKPRLDKILRTNSNEENIRPVFIELLNRCGSHWIVPEKWTVSRHHFSYSLGLLLSRAE